MLKFSFKNKVKVVFNNEGVNKPVYSIRVSTKNELRKFYLMIGFTIQRKQKRLDDCMKRWGFLGKDL